MAVVLIKRVQFDLWSLFMKISSEYKVIKVALEGHKDNFYTFKWR